MKKYFALIVLTVLCQNLSADENYSYFIESQSLKGSTGYIHTFSTRVVPNNTFSFGLHRFNCGINYGLLPGIEVGTNFNLQQITSVSSLDQENFERKAEEIFFGSKFRIMKEHEYPVDVSLGTYKDNIYLVTGKYFEDFDSITLQGGVTWNRDETHTYFTLTESLGWQQAIIEFEPDIDTYNIGYRFLLSPEIKLDFFIQDLTHIKNFFFNNFVFGITIVL